jgi:predicted ATP-dependent endonuclease of OLD family
MKIKKIILENFKFYTNQNLDTRNKNILLYGENGAGKSSLYWALHLFYKTIFSSNQQFFLDKLDQTKSDNLVNHNLNLDAQLTIETNNDSINITKTNISNHSISTDSYKTFHFLNHQKLSDLLVNNYNIYNTIQNDFFGKYILFDELKIILDDTIQNGNFFGKLYKNKRRTPKRYWT